MKIVSENQFSGKTYFYTICPSTLDSAGSTMCACDVGYEMSNARCEDIDECADLKNGGCDQLCINKPGGFMCDCRKGYKARGLFCSDENECLLNNGHGPCQDTCTNTNGGYLCSCEGLAGTQGSDSIGKKFLQFWPESENDMNYGLAIKTFKLYRVEQKKWG